MTGLTIGTQVHFGQTGVIATITEVRTANDGSWTDYRLELPSGGLMWADSRKCEPVTDDVATDAPTVTVATHTYARVNGGHVIHVKRDRDGKTLCGRAVSHYLDAANAYDGLLYAYYSQMCQACSHYRLAPTYADKMQALEDRKESAALDAMIDAETADDAPADDAPTDSAVSIEHARINGYSYSLESAPDDAPVTHAAWVDELTYLEDIAFQALCPCGWTGDIHHADSFADQDDDSIYPVDAAFDAATIDANAHNADR